MKNWWKYLAVLLILYTLIAGILIPLKPGIYSFAPNKITVGESQTISIKGYNTKYKEAGDNNVWLKLPSDRLVKANSVEIISNNELSASFTIGADLPENEIQKPLTLIIDNEIDGYSLHPSAIYIKKSQKPSSAPTKLYDLSEIKKVDSFRFPFQHIVYETIRNTFFHVAIWFAMFLLLIVSCYHSFIYLFKKDLISDMYSSALTSVALMFGIAGLLTGSMWAKYTWGAFWTNDVKLNMSAISLAIYFAYWILRSAISDVDTRARVSSVFNIFAFACLMILVMVIPRLTDSLHPGNGGNPAFGGEDLDNTLRTVFYPAIIGYCLLGFWISQLYFRYLKAEENYTLKEY